MKRWAYGSLSGAAVIAVLCLLIGMYLEYWGVALCALLSVALLMEGRVQVGGRVAHDAIFYIHLLSAVLLGGSLLGALWSGARVFVVLAWIFVVPTIVAGAILWYRGFSGVVIKKAPQTMSGALRESR